LLSLPNDLQRWLLVLLCSSAGHVYSDALTRLNEALAGIASYRAEFVQQIYDQDQVLVQQSEGSLYALRPGKLRWLSRTPFEQLIVVDGTHIWRYEEDLQQVVVSNYSDDLGSTPALLLSGDIESIGARYSVSEVDGQYQLLPRDEQSLFRAMLVRFENGKLSRLILEDTLGQSTRLQMSAIEHNPKLDPALFEFEPPEGVDVLRDE
jgi:outer membrane lipoprotein carrier protein